MKTFEKISMGFFSMKTRISKGGTMTSLEEAREPQKKMPEFSIVSYKKIR